MSILKHTNTHRPQITRAHSNKAQWGYNKNIESITCEDRTHLRFKLWKNRIFIVQVQETLRAHKNRPTIGSRARARAQSPFSQISMNGMPGQERGAGNVWNFTHQLQSTHARTQWLYWLESGYWESTQASFIFLFCAGVSHIAPITSIGRLVKRKLIFLLVFFTCFERIKL